MGISVEEYRRMVLGENSEKKNPKRQVQGRTNRGMGKSFEEEVEFICDLYEKNGLAKIEKTPEPMKILKHIDKSRFEAVFEKAAQPDFKGALKGGRAVVFDAKFTTSDRIRFQALSDYQRETLQKYDEFGAIAFILVGFSDGGIYKISIRTWNDMISEFGRMYIKQEELETLKLRAKTDRNGLVDFLELL
jgi:recombination protein U